MAMARARFSMDNVVKKRVTTDELIGKPQKHPKASQLVMVEEGLRPGNLKRLPDSAPVYVCIYKVTNCAGDCWAQYEGTEAALYQVQMKHDARPSALFDLNRSFGDFLKAAHADNDDVPTSPQDLQQCGIKLILTDAQDPDGVGTFVHWRPAFYVVGTPDGQPILNFLVLLDEWWAYKSKAIGRELQVQYHPHISAITTGCTTENINYEHSAIMPPAATLPMGIFEAQPVISKRIVTVNLQPEDDDTMSILISGNLWIYRARFDAMGIPGVHCLPTNRKKTFIYITKHRGS